MYKEIEPSKDLVELIDTIWTFSNEGVCDSFKILPDACTDLIFDLNENMGFVSGVMTNYKLLELSAESNLIGIRFKAENFGLLSKIPLHEIKNLRTEYSHIFSTTTTDILSELNSLGSVIDKIEFIENFVTTSIKQNYQRQDKLILSVARRIRLSKGTLNVKDLAKSYNISLRHLQRCFKNYIGLTIKEFANVIRFINAKKTIESCKETSLMELAFNLGFYDHSHMNYEL